jgi:hypothetical protein
VSPPGSEKSEAEREGESKPKRTWDAYTIRSIVLPSAFWDKSECFEIVLGQKHWIRGECYQNCSYVLNLKQARARDLCFQNEVNLSTSYTIRSIAPLRQKFEEQVFEIVRGQTHWRRREWVPARLFSTVHSAIRIWVSESFTCLIKNWESLIRVPKEGAIKKWTVPGSKWNLYASS